MKTEISMLMSLVNKYRVDLTIHFLELVREDVQVVQLVMLLPVVMRDIISLEILMFS